MSVFDFIDYRSFLRSYIAKQPRKGRGEVGKIANFIGVHPSLLSQVLSDHKDLNLEQALAVCEFLKLTKQETDYFLISTHYQRAGTVKLKNYYREKLEAQRSQAQDVKERVRSDREMSEVEKAVMSSHWHYAVVWLLSSLKNGTDVDEVSKRLDINREKANDVLNFLGQTGLCVNKSGRFFQGPQSLHLEKNSAHLLRHHANWRLRAIEASDNLTADELMYSAPMSVAKSDIEKIRAKILELIHEVTEIAIESEANQVICFNVDFFKPIRNDNRG